MESKRYATFQCFNPFKKNDHRVRDKKKLRNVSDWMCENFDDLSKEAKVCDSCRKQLTTVKNKEEANEASEDNCKMETDQTFSSTTEVIETLNASLHELDVSPLDKKKIKSKAYASNKVQKISFAMKKKLFTNIQESSDDESELLEKSLMSNLKTNFSICTSRDKKLMILTCLPESWSVRKIMQ